MEPTSSSCFQRLPLLRRLPATPSRRNRFIKVVNRDRRETNGPDDRGKMVNEEMIVQRMRLRETETMESTHVAPSDWMEWEKKYYDRYNEDVCEAMGLLQSYLMNVRPCLAIGMVGIIALSVPFATSVITFKAMVAGRAVMLGFFH